MGYNMRKSTIRSLTAKGYSQKKIAKILHIRKTKVVSAQRQLGIGKKSAFAADVRKYRELMGGEYREAVKKTSMGERWLKKRVSKLSPEEQAMQKFWKSKDTEYRREQFKTGKFQGKLSEKLLEDYEKYFETEK